MKNTKSEDIEQLQKQLKTAATAVKQHGPKFIPIFERAERELDSARSNIDVLDRISKLAA